MKKRPFFRAAALSLALITLLGGCAPKQAGTPSPTQPVTQNVTLSDTPATLGQIADYLVSAADDYNQTDRAALLDGLEGGADALATRVQALVMVSRTFGTLPAPVGNNARLAPQDVDLSGIPDWARADLENLKTGGVLADSDLTAAAGGSNEVLENTDAPAGALKEDMGADAAAPAPSDAANDGYGIAGADEAQAGEGESDADSVSLADVEKVVRRVWNIFGSNLKEYMDNSQLPPGENTAGGLYDLRALVTEQINAIILEVANGSGYAPGSREQKMQDLFRSAADMDARNALGAEPLKPYLQRIDAAQTMEELNDVLTQIQKELAIGGSINVLQLTDTRDNKKWALHIQPAVMPSYTAEEYNDPDNKYIAAQLKLNKTLLMLAGYSEAEAEAQAGATFVLEQKLLLYMPSAEEFNDPAKIYKAGSFDELQAMFPNLDVKAYLEALDFQVPKDFILNAPGLLEAYGKLMTDENLDLFKADAKLGLLSAFARELSQDFLDAYNEYNVTVTGAAEDVRTPEELAADIVNSTLGDYVDQLYVERHFSAEAKADVERMIQSFIDNYKERVAGLDWMSDATKRKAIEKLDNMRFFVGYPDEWDDSLDALDMDPADFFGNQTQARKLTRALTAAEQFEPNTPKLALPVSMVNAYYNQFNNTMAFPAGILQAPFYNVNATEEENLAGIGTIIAHEMTHAFDNNGAKYDKDGNPNDWWTAEDYAKFQELCDQAAEFYDGWESATGISISGSQTLGENISDIGGMACLLDILSQKEDADYDTFFRAYAKSWMKASTRENTEFMAQFDEHGPGNLRTNRVIVNFQEFFNTFDIQPRDGMYVAPEDRVKIW